MCTTGSDRHHQGIEAIIRVCDRDVIQVQEHKCRRESYALISIDERMILAQIKRVRSGHLIKVSMKVLAFEGSLRNRDCRTDKSHVAHAEVSAISSDLVAEYREDFRQGEEAGYFHYFARRSRVVENRELILSSDAKNSSSV